MQGGGGGGGPGGGSGVGAGRGEGVGAQYGSSAGGGPGGPIGAGVPNSVGAAAPSVGTPGGGSVGGGGGGGSGGGGVGKRGRGRPVPNSGGGGGGGGAASSGGGSVIAAGLAAYKIGEAAPSARRKKRKAPEKQIPDRVAALLPESALYTQLLEFEKRVDAALQRKKLDIQDAVRAPARLLKTLRIYVFNTYNNQIPREMSAQQAQHLQQYMADPPSWTLRIMGKILEDDAESEALHGAVPQHPQQPILQPTTTPRFSSFFRRITFQLDRNLYPDNHTIEWDVARAQSHVEGFEIKRKGDQEFKVYIRLEMNYSPERYKLSASLSEMLGIEVDTRPRIIAALWQYIKAKKLQNPSDPTIINCDPTLHKILGEDRIKFSFVSQKLHHHLSPAPPIVLEHTVKLSGKIPVGNDCYDVQVDIPAPLQKEMNAFLQNVEKHRDIDMYDEAICSSIAKINEHRKRRAFFLGFSHSPVDFINGLIASQSRDLKMVAGQGSRNAEKERRSDFYNQPWVEDAVIRYLNRKPQKVPDVPPPTVNDRVLEWVHSMNQCILRRRTRCNETSTIERFVDISQSKVKIVSTKLRLVLVVMA
ncbi:unnamed protein product [Calypogeia fissa]